MAIPVQAQPKRSLAEMLAPFLTQNPVSRLQGTEDVAAIEMPWDDDSLVIRVTDKAQDLFDALNSLHLPPRFSAIWHQKSKKLEFAYAVLPKDSPTARRTFEFRF